MKRNHLSFEITTLGNNIFIKRGTFKIKIVPCMIFT